MNNRVIVQLVDSQLGKKSSYEAVYNPKLLFAIPRAGKREELGVNSDSLPFYGFDCWNHYEVSWLNPKGKPMVAIAEVIYDCHSPMIIESKSMKLYFNSLNNTPFPSVAVLQQIIANDLSAVINHDVQVMLTLLQDYRQLTLLAQLAGENIDKLDVECNDYKVNPNYLSAGGQVVSETLCSDLLKSNCLVTSQPDWGSVQIHYKGKQINREGLLKYLISFRDHHEFHEQCIERIYVDIMSYCEPSELRVYGRFTRRGGLDINPCRATQPLDASGHNVRLIRQ